MKTIFTLLFLAVSTSRAEEPPRFDQSKEATPKFAVRDYSACLKAVERGSVCYLAVGVDPLPGDYFLAGYGAPVAWGRYKCWQEGGENRMVRVDLPPPPPAYFPLGFSPSGSS